MKYCYLFDIDLIERSKYPRFPKLPNHALMKFSSYFKKKGYTVKLVHDIKLIPLNYDENNLYIGSALQSHNLERFKKRMSNRAKFKNGLHLEHIKIGTPLDKCPITDLKGLQCDYTEYDKMIDETGKNLEWYPTNVGLLTRGCIRHCKFCVNRNKNGIVRVDDLDDIYLKKGLDIELLDDNLFSSDAAVELFNQIGDFAREKGVKFHLRNGLDLRTAPEDKIEALKYASVGFDTFHCAWDEVKNSFIFNNVKKVRAEIEGVIIVCFVLCGINIKTRESLRNDLLGFFYRFFMLKRIKVHPFTNVFTDDKEEYKNPYLLLYKLVKKQYNHQQQSKRQHLKRRLSLKQYKLADKVIEILGKYSWLVEWTIGDILELEDFNDKFKEIADEIGVKHYDVE